MPAVPFSNGNPLTPGPSVAAVTEGRIDPISTAFYPSRRGES
jgi:hypothetical protein